MFETEFAFEYQSVDATDILYTLDKCCLEIGLNTSDYSQAHQVKAIEEGGHLDLSGERFSKIDGGSIANFEHDFLVAVSQDIPIDKLAELCELIIGELPVIQAFLHNYDYYYWQNAEDLLLYESDGKDHSTLPKKSNGLPFPLEQTVVDVSNNPGRYILREGFREAVASPMWLRESLIKNISALREIKNVSLSRHKNLIKIESGYQTFDSQGGEQGELQRRLRNAIYGT